MKTKTDATLVKTKKEPFARIYRQDELGWKQNLKIRGLSIIFALVLCGLFVFVVSGANPFEIYKDMFLGTFATPRKITNTIKYMVPYLCLGVALAPAFKMKFWNIGAEGQLLMGALAAAFCAVNFGGQMPSAVLIIVMFIAALLAGALWGFIPAIFKAFWNTNETLFTLMLNYIALSLVLLNIDIWKGTNPSFGLLTKDAWLPELFGQDFLLPLLIVLAVTVAMYIYQKYTKHGYELSVVGESQNTARYAGISVKKVIIRTMIISGALCGLCGFIMVSGIDHTVSGQSAGGKGFTAIIIAWLSKFNPFYMILTSFLIVFLDNAAAELYTSLGLHTSVSSIMTGIILFCILGGEFFINYKVKFRTKQQNKGGIDNV